MPDTGCGGIDTWGFSGDPAHLLRTAGLALAETLSLDEVLERLLDALGELVPYDSAGVMLVEEGHLRPCALRGYERFGDPALVLAARFDAVRHPVLAPVLAGRRSTLIGDTRLHPGWQRHDVGDHVRCWMGIPLISAGRSIGLYSIDSVDPDSFRPEQLRLAEALAPHAVAALHNARHYEQLQRQARLLGEREVELRALTRALRCSEARARAVLDTAGEAYVAADERGRITGWNRQAEEVFGRSRSEALGRDVAETVVPADLREAHHNALRALLAQESPAGTVVGRRLEVRALRGDGAEFPVEVALTALRGEQGWSFNAFLHDISERKRVERFQAVQFGVTRVMAEAGCFSAALPGLLAVIGEGLGFAAAALWLRAENAPPGLARCWVAGGDAGAREAAAQEQADHPLLAGVWASGEPAWSDGTAGLPCGLALPIWRSSPAGRLATGVIWLAARKAVGAEPGLLELADDLGHRIQLHRERCEAEERLRLFAHTLRSISECVSISDLENRPLFVNGAFLRAHGLEEPAQLPPAGPLCADPELSARIHETTLRYGGYSGEVVDRRRDGAPLPLLLSTSLVRDETGRPAAVVAVARDIAERQRAEQALARERAHLAALHDTALAIMDRRGLAELLRALVQRACSLLGAESGYLDLERESRGAIVCQVGTGAFADFVGMTIHRGEALAGRVWQTGSSLVVEDYDTWDLRASHFPAGRIRPMVGVPLRLQGRVAGVLGLARSRAGRPFDAVEVEALERLGQLASLAIDNARLHAEAQRELQERSVAEARLRSSEERLRAVIGGAPIVLWALDRRGRFTLSEGKGLESLGLRPGEIVGRSLEEVYGELPDVVAMNRRALEGETVTGRSELGDRVFESHLAPLWDRGELAGAIGVARDVTERQRAEQALERERAQLRDFVTHAPVPMALLDREARYVAYSRHWLRYWHLSGELAGRDHFELAPGTSQRYRAPFERALSGEVVAEPEDAFPLPDGSRRYMRWAMHPWRGPEGTVQGVAVVVQSVDVLVRARQAALEAARLKSEFLANMSHEIRTPINGVVGLTRLLLESGLSGEQRQYAEMIRSSGDALLGLIGDILDFSKVEAGRLELETIDLDLRRCLEEALGTVAERAAGKGLELAGLVAPELPPLLRGDPTRLRQVLLNLLANAVKFTERGEVVARAELVEASDAEVLVRFSVRDTGIGVARQAQARIFASFAQADGSTSRRYGGTGLGLAIARRLVELMGGTIGVESEPGQGATFWFTTRLGRAAGPVSVARPLDGLSVLVAAPHPATREALVEQLEAAGARAMPLDSATTIGAREGPRPGVVLLDLDLPDAAALRSRLAADGLRVVLVCSLARVAQARALAGLEAYLARPATTARLVEVLAGTAPPAASVGAPRRRFRVLVAEDHDVNQVVALRTLQKLGYQVELARNGREAVEAWARGGFAALLMDVQMPELDGVEATRQIRSREAGRRTPIIALTAALLPEELERCLEAGMDDWIGKPFGPAELEGVLRRWLPAEAEEEVAGPALDPEFLSGLRALDEGAGQILAEVGAIFLRTAPRRLRDLEAALEQGDAEAVARISHGLRGIAGNVGARRLAGRASQLEEQGHSKDLAGSGPALAELSRELQRACQALAAELGSASA